MATGDSGSTMIYKIAYTQKMTLVCKMIFMLPYKCISMMSYNTLHFTALVIPYQAF